MNFIKQIEAGLFAINQARFQDLVNHLLHVQGRTFIAAPGSVVAKEKTSKGAPDSFFSDKGKFCFVECTTLERIGESKTFFNKLLKDVDHCFDESKTGVKSSDIGEVVLAFTGSVSAEEFKSLSERVRSFNSEAVLTVFDIQNLPMHIYSFPGLSEQYVGVTIVKGEIYNLPDFLAKTTRGLQPSLVNAFVGRTEELERAEQALVNSDVLLLSGSAGVGKSKLAVELLSTFAQQNGFIPIVIQSSAVPLWDDFVNLFQNGKDYIMLFDDANKSAQNLGYLLDFMHKPRTSRLKLVITSRDYVKYLVEKKLSDFNFKEIPIAKFKDEAIREIILGALPALKRHASIRQKIVELAKGNARLGLMATYSVQPGAQTNYLDSPLKLYERYFEKVSAEIELFQGSIALQALALVSFFGVLEYDNIKVKEILEKKFALDWKELWVAIMALHDAEILDVHAGDMAKVSDQVLVTYGFYKCFLDPQSCVLDYGSWISEFIASHSSRLKTTLIDVNNTFNYEFVKDLVVPHLKRVSEQITDGEALYVFYKLFWFYLQFDAILYLKRWVAALPAGPADAVLEFNFNANDFQRESAYFELITNFWDHDTELLRPSLEIGFDLLVKEPVRLPEFLKFLGDRFSYALQDIESGYRRQQVLVDFFAQDFSGVLEQRLADGAFLVIAKSLLNIHFTEYRSGRGHTINFVNFDLPYSAELGDLRMQLLNGMLDRFDFSQQLSWEILHQVKHPNGSFPREFRLAEEPIYKRLVKEFLSSENYRDCKLVKKLSAHLLDAGKELPEGWDTFINSSVLRLGKILKNEWDMPEDIGWEEQLRRKQLEHENHIAPMSWPEIRDFLLQVDTFLKQPGLEQEWALDGATTEVFIAIGKKGKQELLAGLEMFFSEEVSFSLQTRLFNFILNNGWLSPAELWDSFGHREFSGLTFWTMAFLDALAEGDINVEYTRLLIGCFKQSEKKLNVHHFRDYLKFNECFLTEYSPADVSGESERHNIISFLLSMMLNKPNDQLALGYHFCIENAVHLSAHPELLKQAYFRLKDVSQNFDHDGKELEAVIELDNEFIIEYLQRRSVNDNYLSFKFEHFKLDCLWDLKDYHSIVSRCLDIIISKSPVFSNMSHSSNTFFLRNSKSDEGKVKAMEVIESYVDANPAHRQKMMMIGNIVLCNYPEEFVAFIKRLLLLNKDFEILKDIFFSVSISVMSGSLIPRMQRELKRVKDVLEMVRTLPGILDYVAHIEYLEAKIGWIKKDIQDEYRRDFEDSQE
jgi:hypothetical protein